jgi:23S rRNA pseudouridine2457 synthase
MILKLTIMTDYKHYKLWKPYGYLSQFVNNQNRRKNKKLLGDLGDFDSSIMPIGRLDEKSEGLIFLTDNGKLSQLVRGGKIEKEYTVKVDGIIDKQAIELLKKGVNIQIHGKTYKTKPCKAILMNDDPQLPTHQKPRALKHGANSWYRIILTEGKFRQVRKMSAAVGFPCLRLIRTRIGEETLDGLIPGGYERVDSFKLH